MVFKLLLSTKESKFLEEEVSLFCCLSAFLETDSGSELREHFSNSVVRVRARALAALTSWALPLICEVLIKEASNHEHQSKICSLWLVWEEEQIKGFRNPQIPGLPETREHI